MATRFFSARDQDLFDRVSDELLGDLRNEKDGIINQNVVVYVVWYLLMLYNVQYVYTHLE